MAPDQLERYREGGRRRTRRRGARTDRRDDPGDGVEAMGHGVLKTAPEGLPEGPSADRAAALQGHRRVARVAGRGVARTKQGEGPCRRAVPGGRAAQRVAVDPRRLALDKLRPGAMLVEYLVPDDVAAAVRMLGAGRVVLAGGTDVYPQHVGRPLSAGDRHRRARRAPRHRRRPPTRIGSARSPGGPTSPAPRSPRGSTGSAPRRARSERSRCRTPARSAATCATPRRPPTGSRRC